MPMTPKISIHAPARGATKEAMAKLFGSVISIHAPARGATVAVSLAYRVHLISIHAPARGATDNGYQQGRRYSDFNPRSREGSDILGYLCKAYFETFQSTLPRGERLAYIYWQSV